jgi:MFS family permease
MPPLEARVKDLLDETRLAMLGTQLLLGLQYRAAFSPGFKRLPALLQMFDCLALLSILVTAGLLLATPAFHQIAEAGHATTRLVSRASAALQAALLPLALAFGIDVAIGLASSAGGFVAGLAGCGFIVGAVLIWYVLPACAAKRRNRTEDAMEAEDKRQSLEDRIVQALTELRVILPGAQALFGFQVSAVLTDSFHTLSASSAAVHLASMGLVVVAIILLIAPATYHRIAASGNADEAVLQYTVTMMLPAVGLIALGLVGDAYVTVRMITDSFLLAIMLGMIAALGFFALLYVLPLAARRKRQQEQGHAIGSVR